MQANVDVSDVQLHNQTRLPAGARCSGLWGGDAGKINPVRHVTASRREVEFSSPQLYLLTKEACKPTGSRDNCVKRRETVRGPRLRLHDTIDPGWATHPDQPREAQDKVARVFIFVFSVIIITSSSIIVMATIARQQGLSRI